MTIVNDSIAYIREWDDTALETQDLKFESWWSEAEHATFQSRKLHTILNIYEWAEKETFCFFETWIPEWGSNPRSPTFLAEAALTTGVVSTSQQRHVPSGLALLCEQAWQTSRTKINEMNRALGTNRLIWAMRTFWWWLGEWDDTALQTQDSKLKHWGSEAQHAISRSRKLPTILNLHEGAGKKHFVSLKHEWLSEVRAWDLRPSKQAA